jgi:hypothetical protein
MISTSAARSRTTIVQTAIIILAVRCGAIEVSVTPQRVQKLAFQIFLFPQFKQKIPGPPNTALSFALNSPGLFSGSKKRGFACERACGSTFCGYGAGAAT